MVYEEVTKLLRGWATGDAQAAEAVVPLIYRTLGEIADRLMVGERPEHTLEPAALINEAYLRLVRQRRITWESRVQFYSVATKLMRRILLDHARRRSRVKRGGGWIRVALDDWIGPSGGLLPDVGALDDALNALAKQDPKKATLVELRFFGGLSVAETGRVLGWAPRTVGKQWQLTRAWLRRELGAG